MKAAQQVNDDDFADTANAKEQYGWQLVDALAQSKGEKSKSYYPAERIKVLAPDDWVMVRIDWEQIWLNVLRVSKDRVLGEVKRQVADDRRGFFALGNKVWVNKKNVCDILRSHRAASVNSIGER